MEQRFRLEASSGSRTILVSCLSTVANQAAANRYWLTEDLLDSVKIVIDPATFDYTAGRIPEEIRFLITVGECLL